MVWSSLHTASIIPLRLHCTQVHPAAADDGEDDDDDDADDDDGYGEDHHHHTLHHGDDTYVQGGIADQLIGTALLLLSICAITDRKNMQVIIIIVNIT